MVFLLLLWFAFSFSSLVSGVIEWNGRDACTSAAQLAEEQAAAQVSGSGTRMLLAPQWWLAIVCLCCAIVLWRVLGGTKAKPKLN